jgi:hypothetical protein
MSGSPWLSLSIFYTYAHIQINAAAVQTSLLNEECHLLGCGAV